MEDVGDGFRDGLEIPGAPRNRFAARAVERGVAAEPPSLHLTPRSPSWPAALEVITPPPEALWLRGRTELLARPHRVAVVGTRSPTPYGESQALRFARALAARGVVIVSGLARGIDQAAHAGALEAGGGTIAVLGSGVDRPWPRGPLADEVARRGLLLSELPPGQPPRRHHFPLRNRLISALASAVIVVEAARASGSLITARWAADQGRDVLAIPGRVDHPMAAGCHRLIREGAELLESPDEILSALGLAPAPAAGAVREAHAPPHPILEALLGETLGVDQLSERLVTSVAEVQVALVQLELAGRVLRCPGGLYRLA